MTNLDDYRIREQPYYKPVGTEIALFEAAHQVRMPMMLKGPTGCGKTRFIEFMAWRLKKPLVTVACHEDMTASDLIGRFLLGLDAYDVDAACERLRQSSSVAPASWKKKIGF